MRDQTREWNSYRGEREKDSDRFVCFIHFHEGIRDYNWKVCETQEDVQKGHVEYEKKGIRKRKKEEKSIQIPD